ECCENRSVELLGMVGVHDDDRCKGPGAQQPNELVGDALRDHDGQACMHAEPAEMRDASKLVDHLAQPLVAERQWITATQYDFVDRSVVLEVLEDRGPARTARLLGSVREVAAKTITAVDSAGPGRYDQHEARIFLGQPRRNNRS